ncbi:MAG TPA: phosphoglucosamine mutase [Pyrinomonadaceae bacterium]|nr:phosphoglucosamine mutase [Pyrinomonadaceae bacterium]
MTTPIKQRLFGTDGVRGEAGRFPLDAATIETIGASLATRLGKAPLIVVGRDTRESGEWLERALIAGALSQGARCESAGVITTPGVAFLTRSLGAQAGVVISASHNPYQDNGVKIFAPSGRKLDDDTERLIEADIFTAQDSLQLKPERTLATPDHSAELCSRYLTFLEKEIGAGLSLADQVIVVDTANGAASQLAPELFASLGARVIAINNQPDGRNINLNCGSLHIEGLQQQVVASGATLGVAFDGDADRALFVDAHGEFVDGDATLWVLANNLHARGELKQKLIVATVMSNIGLEIALRSRDLKLQRTDVGDKYVLEELLRTGANLGGEQSGHIIFPSISLAGDGMITTLCLLRAMTDEQKSLHMLTQGFQRFPQILVNIKVREKRPFSEVPAIKDLAGKTEALLGEKGRLLLRYSGTESLARVMIEGENQTDIERYAGDLAAVIQEQLG